VGGRGYVVGGGPPVSGHPTHRRRGGGRALRRLGDRGVADDLAAVVDVEQRGAGGAGPVESRSSRPGGGTTGLNRPRSSRNPGAGLLAPGSRPGPAPSRVIAGAWPPPPLAAPAAKAGGRRGCHGDLLRTRRFPHCSHRRPRVVRSAADDPVQAVAGERRRDTLSASAASRTAAVQPKRTSRYGSGLGRAGGRPWSGHPAHRRRTGGLRARCGGGVLVVADELPRSLRSRARVTATPGASKVVTKD
jgi:hypothetical protein